MSFLSWLLLVGIVIELAILGADRRRRRRVRRALEALEGPIARGETELARFRLSAHEMLKAHMRMLGGVTAARCCQVHAARGVRLAELVEFSVGMLHVHLEGTPLEKECAELMRWSTAALKDAEAAFREAMWGLHGRAVIGASAAEKAVN